MYCPQCRKEYQPDTARCPRCGRELVESLPPTPREEPEWTELVTVYEAPDVSMLAIAKSLLDEAGIPYYTPTEGIQEMIGGGRILGPSLALGPVLVQVPPQHVGAAQQALKRLSEPGEALPEED